jgi:hypothetical protein
MALYIENGINIFLNVFLYHGLGYYHNLTQILLSFLVLIWLCNTLTNFKRYVIKPKGLLGYPTKGIACALSIPKHEQYLFDSLDQNNLTHGVY